jgi:two-component system, chemotaxis family, protein-glutamate methylesterase/glutaminase
MTRDDDSPVPGLVVLAASAGGLEPIATILAALPEGYPLPIAVILHRSPSVPSVLAAILRRRTRLTVRDVQEGDALRAGTVYVAPPARHLVVNADRTLGTMDGARRRGVLSSANPLLESAAAALRGGVIAVVLSGSGMDATDGVQSVKRHGGIVLVQDRESAAFFGMPGAAIATGVVDGILPLEEIAPTLVRLAQSTIAGSPR